MTQALQTVQNQAITWSPEQVDMIKRTIAKGATDDELKLFLHVSGRSGLDPFARQIYAVKRYDSKLAREVMSIQTSIDGFRLIAERSGKYAGQLGPHWCGSDGVWKDVWLSNEPPRAAKVGVMKLDFKAPLEAIALWDDYKQEYRDKQGGYQLTAMWAKMPTVMLAKCAEALALRKAFPQDLSGLYTSDEMSQDTGTIVPKEEDPDDKKPIPNPFQKPKQVESVTLISEAQLKRLYAISNAGGWKSETVKAMILKEFEVDSSKKLNRVQYDQLCTFLEKNRPPVEASPVPESNTVMESFDRMQSAVISSQRQPGEDDVP